MRRHLPAAAYALFLTGIAVGLAGLLRGDGELVTGGSIVAFAGVPGIVASAINRAHRVSDDQIAGAHRAGYELALDHVARGLLDPREKDTPPHGHGTDPSEAEQTESNVRQLHVIRYHAHTERKAL